MPDWSTPVSTSIFETLQREIDAGNGDKLFWFEHHKYGRKTVYNPRIKESETQSGVIIIEGDLMEPHERVWFAIRVEVLD